MIRDLNGPSEHDTAAQVVKWFAYAHKGLGVPDARLLVHVPNGTHITPNQFMVEKLGYDLARAIKGKKLKEAGVRAGYPDFILDFPRGPYHGLRIELKKKGGKASDAQLQMMPLLMSQGYHVKLCTGFAETVTAIEMYCRLPRPPQLYRPIPATTKTIENKTHET